MGHRQAINIDLFIHFSCGRICERCLKSVSVVVLLSNREMHAAI